MINLIFLGLINSLIIFGVYEATAYSGKTKFNRKDSNILGWFAFKGDKLLPYTLTEPLWNCKICMSSFHSLYVYWGYQWLTGITWTDLLIYPCYILMLAGINYLLDKI